LLIKLKKAAIGGHSSSPVGDPKMTQANHSMKVNGSISLSAIENNLKQLDEHVRALLEENQRLQEELAQAITQRDLYRDALHASVRESSGVREEEGGQMFDSGISSKSLIRELEAILEKSHAPQI
jgi:hypothetical protein